MLRCYFMGFVARSDDPDLDRHLRAHQITSRDGIWGLPGEERAGGVPSRHIPAMLESSALGLSGYPAVRTEGCPSANLGDAPEQLNGRDIEAGASAAFPAGRLAALGGMFVLPAARPALYVLRRGNGDR